MMKKIKAKLVLENGMRFHGTAFGYKNSVSGEVVFNTAMTGYPESLTDPSYKGQILVATYPIIGNYGVPGKETERNLLKYFESDKIAVTAFIVSEYTEEFSHWNAEESLHDWMVKNDIPGIYGIDTRALTKVLRESGTMLGKIIINEEDIDLYDPNLINLVAEVSPNEKEEYGEGKHRVVLIDCGVKNNIIRCLLDHDTTVVRVPWDYDLKKENYDGLFISNGPGDPKMCDATIETLKYAMEDDKPIFGICLGSQLLALASGAETYKLKFGHRSHNQPVKKTGSEKCYITSQNHGFAVDEKTLSNDWLPLFKNLNDDTMEGIIHKSKPFFATQFHPEATGGPTDTKFLFDDFIKLIEDYKKEH